MAYPAPSFNGDIYTDPSSGLRYQYDAALEIWALMSSAAGSLTHQTVPVAANGQTAFVLSAVPTDPLTVVACVNGVNYHQPDIIVAGNNVTWSGPVTLETTDRMVFTYI